MGRYELRGSISHLEKKVLSKKYHAIHGHSSNAHIVMSLALPMHGSPSGSGGGWVQDLTLDWLPFPHVTEHEPHSDQSVQLPSTEIEHIKDYDTIYYAIIPFYV